MLSHVTNNENDDIYDQHAITEEVYNFYKDLYSSHDRYLTNVDLKETVSHFVRKLSKSEAMSLEGPVNYGEVLKSLKSMKNNKSPGPDGFTIEFFKFFWNELGWFLVRSLNDGYDKAEMSITQRHGIISLIPKGDKPRNFLRNWRPISLLNVTYKIASSCIANRIKGVLSNLISFDQNGFLKGRYTGDCIRTVYDIMHSLQEDQSPGILFSIDFEKAFDSVSLSFIRKVLDLFNFGPSILQWFDTFYKNASLSVLVNGFSSHSFPYERACRQGDPLSPYLFILAAEILNVFVKNNNSIHGIVVGEHEYKMTQYADDTTFFIEANERSFLNLYNQIEYFVNCTGLRVNLDKCFLVGIGSLCVDQLILNILKVIYIG